MTQADFDFDARQLPIAGKTIQAKHASYTGAKRAAEDRAFKTRAFLTALKIYGPLTDHAAAVIIGCGLSSINSIRNGVEELVEPCGFETHQFANGRTTKRTKWGLRA